MYLLIIAGVVTLFSVLTIYQADNSFSDPVVGGSVEILLTAKEAQSIAQKLHPGVLVDETEYEIENDALYFTTTFSDETETKVNLFTGEVLAPGEEAGVIGTLVDDFDEKVLWVALFVFVLASLLSIYVANQALAPIAQNIRKQKEFVSGAAHELRNPLAALHARIESVLLLDSKEVSKTVLQDLLSETKRLILLSEGLLSLEKAEVESVELREVAMSPIVTSLTTRVAELAKEKGLSIKTEIGTETVLIDPKDLEVILFNLLHNAIKFTPPNGKIFIRWKDRELVVEDTGIGISNNDIDHIFDRFYKADASRGREGSGLGLALVKMMVEKYNGKIEVSSAAGKVVGIKNDYDSADQSSEEVSIDSIAVIYETNSSTTLTLHLRLQEPHSFLYGNGGSSLKSNDGVDIYFPVSKEGDFRAVVEKGDRDNTFVKAVS